MIDGRQSQTGLEGNLGTSVTVELFRVDFGRLKALKRRAIAGCNSVSGAITTTKSANPDPQGVLASVTDCFFPKTDPETRKEGDTKILDVKESWFENYLKTKGGKATRPVESISMVERNNRQNIPAEYRDYAPLRLRSIPSIRGGTVNRTPYRIVIER